MEFVSIDPKFKFLLTQALSHLKNNHAVLRKLCDLFQVDLLRLQSEGQPSMTNVEKIVTQLVRANQVTQQSLDEMLCHTPTGKQTPIMQRRTSRRTLKPLQSTLLSE